MYRTFLTTKWVHTEILPIVMSGKKDSSCRAIISEVASCVFDFWCLWMDSTPPPDKDLSKLKSIPVDYGHQKENFIQKWYNLIHFMIVKCGLNKIAAFSCI